MKQKIKTHIGAQQILQLCCAHPKTTNTESGEPELNKVGNKSQDKKDIIIHNTIINAI